ncbi:MAG: sigma-70 family RNA polymerase sigma factor [Planctomycetota bacterium]|nr:MAG: sigma-70 family RNA polymerase sigma factor [Planctomycetota bacterium]
MSSEFHLEAMLSDAPRLRRMALGLARDAHLAEDLVQETWLAALRARPSTDRALAPWLARVLERIASVQRRTHARRIEREHAIEPAVAAEPTADVVGAAERQSALLARILELDEPYRSVVLLRYYEGLTPAEIALRTGAPVRTVHTRLARALALLRAKLGARDGSRARWLAALGWGALGMKTKALVGCAVLLVLLGVLARWNTSRDSAGTASQAAPIPAASLAAAVEPDAVAAALAERQQVESAPAVGADAQAPRDERRVRGRVVTTERTPLAGVAVVARDGSERLLLGVGGRDDERPINARTTTDADGGFALDVAPHHNLDLAFELAGYSLARRSCRYGGEELVVVLSRAARFAGRVTDGDGAPLTGARVRMQNEGVHDADREFAAIVAPDGRFEIAGVDPGVYRATAHADGRLPETAAQLAFVEGASIERDFALARGGVLRGLLTDGALAKPLPGASVTIGFDDAASSAIADADGRYQLAGIPAGTFRVRVEAPGYGRYDFRIAEARDAAKTLDREQDFFLMPARSAGGRVVDCDGAPIAGATLWCSARAESQSGSQHDDLWSTTGADGRFALTPLRYELHHTLLVQAPGHALAVFDFPANERRERRTELGDLALEAPGAIAGTLCDAHGTPLEGLWVLLSGEPARRDMLGPVEHSNAGYRSSEGFGFGRVLARTDDRGRFAFFGLPGGTYALSGGDKGYAIRAAATVELASGATRDDVALVVDRGLSIAGRVLDPTGRPIAGASVDAYVDEATWVRATYALTNDVGRFELHGLAAGNYLLSARPFFDEAVDGVRLVDGGRVAVEAGRSDVELRLARAAPIAGVVRGPEGEPVAGIHIALQRTADHGLLVNHTDGAGRFAFDVADGTRVDLRFMPTAAENRAAFAPVLNADGTADMSYDVRLDGVLAGTSDLQVTMPRLPDRR